MVRSIGLQRAFRHPFVVISILVLLANDHILKAIMTSDLTGKLSDLAGLFFFPFLLGTILQGLAKLAWPARRFPARQVLSVSFGLCLVVFTGIKTIPAVNDFTAGLLSTFFHLPVGIALDPTDMVSFVVFIPAWMLWDRIERGLQPTQPGKLEYIILCLGALASVATSPCMTIPSVQRLLAIDGVVYTRVEPDGSSGYLSRDSGNTWEAAQPIPPDILSDMLGASAMPLTLCEPENERICYRINGQPWIEESIDGGIDWQIAWQIPSDRVSYLRRANNIGTLSCGKDPNLVPQDMAFVTQAGNSVLVVAMGNEGVIVHSSAGDWQRIAVGPYMVPTPVSAGNLQQAWSRIWEEIILGLAGVGLIYIGLSLWAWIWIARHRSPNAIYSPKWIFRPAWVALGWILAVATLPFFGPFANYFSTIWLLAAVTLPLALLVISITIWIRAGSRAANPGRYRLYGLAALMIGLVVFAVFMGCFLLWALGIIARYEVALLGAVLVSGFFFIFIVFRMRRGLHSAIVGVDQTAS